MNIHTHGRQAAREYLEAKKQIWVTTSFTGVYPVGVAALVCETTAEKAAEALNKVLKDRGLIGDATAENMVCLAGLQTGHVHILQDGNY